MPAPSPDDPATDSGPPPREPTPRAESGEEAAAAAAPSPRDDEVAFTAIQETKLPDTHRPEGMLGDLPADGEEASPKGPRKSGNRKAKSGGRLELRQAVTRLPSEDEQPKPAEVGVQWYVVRVQSGREGSVKRVLDRRVREEGLEEKIVAIHVPVEDVVEVRDGKKRTVKRKLFPGYVILQMLLDEDTTTAIRRTPGVGDFVTLQPMTEREIEQIARVVRVTPTKGAGVKKPEIKIALTLGQNIKIKEGPFENFEGPVLDVNPDKGVVKVQVEIFGRKTEVELEHWQVEAI